MGVYNNRGHLKIAPQIVVVGFPDNKNPNKIPRQESPGKLFPDFMHAGAGLIAIS